MSFFRHLLLKLEEVADAAKLNVKQIFNLFDPVFIYPYRGYGNENEAWLYGRILEKESIIHDKHEIDETLWRNARKFWKRFESDEIPGVGVSGRLKGIEAIATSDHEGYFMLEFKGLNGIELDNGWHDVELEITDMPYRLKYEKQTTGEVLICRQNVPFGIISDVDDTIIRSHATSTFYSTLTMIRHDARSRTPFEGVSDLYKTLMDHGKNPLFFVSGSSYNLYDLLISFCEYQDIPKAPFFLRNIGLELKQWFKQDTMPYKLEYIQWILDIYQHLPFILIGDSGQHDPEVYLEVHNQNPGRIKAVYIRHVHTDQRKKELLKLSESLEIPFLVLDDSHEAIEHARKMQWI